MREDVVTQLDFLRHGEPVGGRRFRGNGVDDPLSELGWQQMRATVGALAGWDRVYSSPMRRCRAFAEWLARDRGLTLEIIDDLREVGFGSWEGMDPGRLRLEQPAEYRDFYLDPVHARPLGAEPLDEFGARVSGVFERLVQQATGQRLLVVCHAGIIRATLGHVTRAPAVNWYRAEVHNAAVSRFAHDQQGARLISHNWRPTM